MKSKSIAPKKKSYLNLLFTINLLSALSLFIPAPVFSQLPRRELIVSMYPFIPNPDNFYRKLETKFEAANPEIDLIIKLNDSYYDEEGIIKEMADLYEVDCILLKDFIAKKKIQKIPDYYSLPLDRILPAANIVYQDRQLYGVPHWICGNFLIYNKTDSLLTSAKTLNDLQTVFGSNPPLSKGLLIDMKGKLTLGELYADGLMDQYKNVDSVKKYVALNHLDTLITIPNLCRVQGMTFADWGRDDDYHNKNFFYQKQFAKGNGRAFVGYSESLYTILDEINNACSKEEKCFDQKNISIKEWALSDQGSTPVGWVDALCLDAGLSGTKLKDAMKFISFCVNVDTYHLALIPDYGDSPRYLLPAYKDYFTDQLILDKAPLYSQLYPLANRIVSFTGDGASPILRKIGKEIDSVYLKNKK